LDSLFDEEIGDRKDEGIEQNSQMNEIESMVADEKNERNPQINEVENMTEVKFK
jgi:hypothetical protein